MRLCFLLLLSLGSMAEAQFMDLLPGSRLRVESRVLPGRIEGTLMSNTGDSLVIAKSGAIHTPVPRGSVTWIRVSEGRSRGAGAAKGAKIGVIIFTGVMAMSITSVDREGLPLAGAMIAGGAISGAFYGSIIGAIVGAERWKTVYRAPLKLDASR